jgi:sec-independent protein translocase protein TatA
MNLFIVAGVIGPWQVVIIAAVALLMFGGKKIPELMGGIGKGMKEFKKAIKEEDDTSKGTTNETPKDETKKE